MDSISRFIDAEIAPYCDEWEEAQSFPAHQLFKKLGNAGFLGINKPTEYGGMGLDFTYNIAAAEACSKIQARGIGMGMTVQSDMATPALARHGSDALKRNYLAPALAGDVVVCLGVSESGAGSDVSSLKTRARKDGDDYIIDGSKIREGDAILGE